MILYPGFLKKHVIIWIELAIEIKTNLQGQENIIRCIEKAVKICSVSQNLKSLLKKTNNYPRKDHYLHPENISSPKQRKV
jgi:uncharacterized OsmC-like protein